MKKKERWKDSGKEKTQAHKLDQKNFWRQIKNLRI